MALRRAKAVALVAGMVVGCVAIWTVHPVLWLWVGSQVDQGGPPSMGAVVTVLVGIVGGTLAIAKVLAILHARYRALKGTRATIKLHLPWLRSLRGARPHERAGEVELTVLDVILVTSVILALLAYQYWFFFEAGSPFDQRTGRE